MPAANSEPCASLNAGKSKPAGNPNCAWRVYSELTLKAL